MNIRKISKINKLSTENLHHAFVYLRHYDNNIDFEQMKCCIDSIYVINEDTRPYGIYSGIIGCRRISWVEDEFKQWTYKCKPYNIIYSIDFLFYDDSYNTSIEADIIEYTKNHGSVMTNPVYKMIEECLADKNDCFVLYTVRSNETPKCHKLLTLLGFCLEEKNVTDGLYLYIRAPRTNE